MSVDSEGSLICDISRLENHLIHQQNTQQQNYSQHDVTELTEFLTKQSYPTPNCLFTHHMEIKALLSNHTVNDVTLQAATEFYINTVVELVEHHHRTLFCSQDMFGWTHWKKNCLMHL